MGLKEIHEGQKEPDKSQKEIHMKDRQTCEAMLVFREAEREVRRSGRVALHPLWSVWVGK